MSHCHSHCWTDRQTDRLWVTVCVMAVIIGRHCTVQNQRCASVCKMSLLALFVFARGWPAYYLRLFRLNFVWKLLKLIDEYRRYSKQNQCYFWYTAWLKRPNFWVYVCHWTNFFINKTFWSVTVQSFMAWLVCAG